MTSKNFEAVGYSNKVGANVPTQRGYQESLVGSLGLPGHDVEYVTTAMVIHLLAVSGSCYRKIIVQGVAESPDVTMTNGLLNDPLNRERLTERPSM
jgi:hypothetical protein